MEAELMPEPVHAFQFSNPPVLQLLVIATPVTDATVAPEREMVTTTGPVAPLKGALP
jgi:hypothetical protein